jgi:segregation and condensation protein B
MDSDSNAPGSDESALVEAPPELSGSESRSLAQEPATAEPSPGHPEIAPEPQESAEAPLEQGAGPAGGAAGEAAGEAAGIHWTDDGLERAVAAILFASSEPLSNARIAAALTNTSPAHVAAAIDRVSSRLVASGLPFELIAIAGGWQLFSARDMADVVSGFTKGRRDDKVSPAALETLAVVAYRQPVSKAEIEAVRGVQAGPILRALVDRGLIKVAGRSEDPGHALLYGTTRKFLDTFGLSDLKDLPRDAELVRDS